MNYGKIKAIPTLRYKDPEQEGIFETVSLQFQTYNPPGAVKYNADKHKGHLYCTSPGCNAKMHYNGGSKNVLANVNLKFDEHFKTNPNQEHSKSCNHHERMRLAKLDFEELSHDFDDKKGYSFLMKIDADLQADSAIVGTPAYTRKKEDGKFVTVVNNKHLEMMERISIRDMTSLANYMEDLDTKRMASGFAVRNEKVIPWSEFFVRYNRKSAIPKINPETGKTIPLHHPRFENLYTSLKQTGKPQMCVMEVNAEFIVPDAEAIAVQSRKVRFVRGESKSHTGKIEQDAIFLNPKVYLETKKNPDLEGIMEKGKKYLVFGEVKLKENARGKSANLCMSVSKLEQIVEIDLDAKFARSATPPQTPSPVSPGPNIIPAQTAFEQPYAAQVKPYTKPEQLCLQLNASFR